jgi:GxxExxY protein
MGTQFFNMTKSTLSDLIYAVNGAAIEVHKSLGPGLLESVYHQCLKKELTLEGISFQSELVIPVYYKGFEIDTELRCDLFIESILPVELKAVEKILPIHEAQLLTYMNLLKVPKGLLLNFQCTNLFREGQKTMVNDLFRSLPEN